MIGYKHFKFLYQKEKLIKNMYIDIYIIKTVCYTNKLYKI